MNPAEPDADAERIERLISASEDLALATIEYQERAKTARKRFRITMIGISLIGVLLLTTNLILFAFILADLHSGEGTRKTIADCVKPTGTCFRDAQQRTARVVGSINQVSGLAAACAPNYVNLPLTQRVAAIQHCIARNLH